MECVKVGFVGCGAMASVHRDRLAGRADVHLAGCCDILPEQAEAFAAKQGIPVFKDAVSLYDGAKPDAVYIAVPPFAHGAIETDAADRGIHLFIEMPAALDLQTARTVAAAVRKAKILVMAGYCHRYSDLAQTAQHLLKGEVISLARPVLLRHAGSGLVAALEQSGGQIVEQTSHIIDLLLHLCGPVSEVHAMGARGCLSRVKNFDVDESSVINLRLKTGAVASISSTCILNQPGSMSLEIATPRLCLSLADASLRLREDHKIVEYLNHMDMYEKESEIFIHAVQQGKRGGIRSTYSDALKTLRVTLAANESIHTGLPVVL